MTGPTVTLAEAARRSPKSEATIRRWLKADKLEGAERTAEGWSIPVASLVESGAWPSTTPADEDQADDLEAGPLAPTAAPARKRWWQRAEPGRSARVVRRSGREPHPEWEE